MEIGFAPVYNPQSKILILGSFPSVKSRAVGFYYGNKQNRFWRMLSATFEAPIGEQIEEKIAFLHQHHIALWDVVECSDLVGSDDKNLDLSNHTICDISFLLPPSTNVNCILCNGKTAYHLLTENFETSIPILCMPSTSPANPRYRIEPWKEAIENGLKKDK